ncbi:MAG TPA: Cj0069 family protein [Burkholderiales bacterium]|jgi:hypothetical protein
MAACPLSPSSASQSRLRRIALLYPGNRALRDRPDVANGRFANVHAVLTAQGAQVEAAIWHEDFRDEVREQLMQVDAALVWVNPIEDGRDRGVLDTLLREVAATGVFVSAHPDVILKLGTKEVLYTTRELGWGCDTHLYRTPQEMRAALPARLRAGARVLKQYRGNGGNGVWKLELDDQRDTSANPSLKARHARRGSAEERLPLADFIARCAPYFEGAGRMIDQAWQPRLTEGMVRCYLVHDQVAGFGVQAINALYSASPGEAAPATTPRLYHPATLPQCQTLKRKLEGEWLPALRQLLKIGTHELPILWDCDFMLGPKDAAGEDTHVLCEINVSSVSPFPESALGPLARAMPWWHAAAPRPRRAAAPDPR